jgi:putative ubiquitin-RnfH superfamily antitoxin RatB of RatAB toxin-antitoxin module
MLTQNSDTVSRIVNTEGQRWTKGEGIIENKDLKTQNEDRKVLSSGVKDTVKSARSSIKARIVFGLVAGAVCVCVVVFGPGLAELAKQRGQAGTIEKDGIAPVVITDPDGSKQDGEIAQEGETVQQSGASATSSAVQTLSPAEPANVSAQSGADEYATEGEGVVTEEDRQAAQSMLHQLIDENNSKVERKELELADMKAMLDLLTEMGDDPDRVELYKKLISDTKDELQKIREQTERYEKELTKE